MAEHIWVRAEQRGFEKRVGITPQGVKTLMDAGFRVTVERSDHRIIPIEDYQATGCEIADANSWPQAPRDAWVFGLKELPEDNSDLPHRHVMFGHAYKGQAGAEGFLSRFTRAGGALYDLEYLTSAEGRRVAAFGYWAGFAGAAVGVLHWIAQQRGEIVKQVPTFPSREPLVAHLQAELSALDQRPNAIVIGALGRVGSGARALFESLDIDCTAWDMAETASGGPFTEILQHSIFVNCILANAGVPVFVSADMADSPRELSVIADVSCDPSSAYNPIPLYDAAHSFESPSVRVRQSPVLDITAIDNLPSMLPLESSEDFALQLLPHLQTLPDGEVWQRALNTFQQFS